MEFNLPEKERIHLIKKASIRVLNIEELQDKKEIELELALDTKQNDKILEELERQCQKLEDQRELLDILLGHLVKDGDYENIPEYRAIFEE